MSEGALTQLIGKEKFYNVIRLLRDGPMKHEEILNFLTSSSSKMNKKAALKLIKELEKNKLIVCFEFKPDVYILLVKDFYLIRVPSKPTINYIQKKSGIPAFIRERYLALVKQYFSSYVKSNSKIITDFELNLINIVLNPGLNEIIKNLGKKPVKVDTFQKKNPHFVEKIKNAFLKYDIIEILPYKESSPDKSWIFLKTDLNFNFFFPEYLIKNITEDLRAKKINKVLALKSLYTLKSNYLQVEKASLYQTLKARIENKEEIVKAAEKKGEEPLQRYNELKKLYKEIGDFDNRILMQEKIKALKNT
jgi:hypothetical protein